MSLEQAATGTPAEIILGSTFLSDSLGRDITGRMIADAFAESYRRAPRKLVRKHHVHMRQLADFMRESFALKRTHMTNGYTGTDQQDAFLATSVLYALKTAGIMTERPNSYNRKFRRWDVDVCMPALAPVHDRTAVISGIAIANRVPAPLAV